MKTIDQILKEEIRGLYYGNRILLPFNGHVLKAIIEKDIITDFSKSSNGCSVRETQDYLEIYFYDYKHLKETIGKFENVKLVIVEKGKNVFDFSNHRKIALYLENDHKIRIEEIKDDEILFIE